MRVLYYTNLPVPYRMDFFNELGKKCELTVWVETEKRKKSNAAWLKRNLAESFKYEELKKIELSDGKYINYGYIKRLKREHFDVVVVGIYNSVSAMLFIETLRKVRIPYILNSDGGFVKPDSRIKKFIKHHFISGAVAYLSTGRLTDQYLVYYGAEKGRIYRYPFTSTSAEDLLQRVPTREEKQQIREKLGIKDQTVFVSVGSCIRRKGYDVLLEACKKLSIPIGFYLIGGKSTDDQLEKLKMSVKQSKLSNVHFIEFLDKTELKAYYQAADAFVLPTREDVWGLVINEAAASALPVVTTDRCIAGTELVKNGQTGYLVPVEDSTALANAIQTVAQDSDKREIMAENILETAGNYTIEKMVKVHLDVFQKVMEGF